MDENILELLYRSFDSDLNPDERKNLDDALKKSEELRLQKKEIEKIRTSLNQSEPQNFGYMFADKIMQKINGTEERSEEKRFFDSITSVFRPLAIAATVFLVFLVSYNLISENGNMFNDSQEIQNVTLAEVFDPFNDFSME